MRAGQREAREPIKEYYRFFAKLTSMTFSASARPLRPMTAGQPARAHRPGPEPRASRHGRQPVPAPLARVEVAHLHPLGGLVQQEEEEEEEEEEDAEHAANDVRRGVNQPARLYIMKAEAEQSERVPCMCRI